MTRARTLPLLALLLVGCQRTPTQAPLPAAPAPVVRSQAVAAPALANAPVDPDARATLEATNPQWALLADLGRHGGVIGDFQSLVTPDSAYGVQITPQRTQDQAETLAHQWADDARQLYIGWGFWMTPLLGKVRHVYYSAKKGKTLELEYSFTSGRLTRTEKDGADDKDAFLVLRDAYDIHGYTAVDAWHRAKEAGYRPGKYTVASLLQLVLFGPVWVFMDDRSMQPTVLVKADSGETVTGGPLMWAVQYLIKKAAPAPIQ